MPIRPEKPCLDSRGLRRKCPNSRAGIACPDGMIPNTFASAQFGAQASKCGNVAVNGGIVTMTSPNGAVDAALLTQFLGNPNITSQIPVPVLPAVGSGFAFINFNASPGDLVTFNWTAEFEQGAAGAVFAVLDNQFQLLNFMVPTIATSAPANHAQFTVGAGTTHNLGFAAVNLIPCLGPVEGCLVQVRNLVLADPALNISNLNLVPAAAIPEPGTISLFGLGIGLGILVRVRRRRA